MIETEREPMVSEPSLRLEPPTTRRGRVLRSLLNYAELRHTPYGLVPIAMFCLLAITTNIQGQALSFAGPNIAQDLHLDLREIIGIFVVLNFVLLIAQIGFAFLLERRKRARWIGIGNILSALAGMATSRSVDQGTYVGPGIVGAIGNAAQVTPSYSLIADYYPVEARGRVAALFQTFTNAAVLVATVFGGLMVAAIGWRSLNLVLSIPIVLAGLFAFKFLREPRRGYFDRIAAGLSEEDAKVEDPALSFGESFRSVMSARTVRRLVYADIIGNVGALPFALLFQFMLADYYGLDVAHRAFVALPSVIAALVGGYLGGGALDTLAARSPSSVLRVAGMVSLIGAAGTLLVAAALPLPMLVIFNCVSAFAAAAVAPASFALTSQVIPPNTRTLGLSLVNNLPQIPGLLLITAFGGIASVSGYSPALFACVPCLVVAALLRITAADFFETDRNDALITLGAREEWQRERDAEAAHARPPIRLLCRKVDVGYDTVQVVFGADFEVREGEIVALLGTNGAGKSTLLRAISGTQEAWGGSIIYDGRDITHMPPAEIAARGVIHMPGGRGVFQGLNVADNLELGSWLHPANGHVADLEGIYNLFPVLRERGHEPAGALSGGEQQMLSLAQAMLSRPGLLLIDELSLGLSPAMVAQLLEVIKRIRDQGTAVVIVEQSVNVALTVADRAVFMEKGEVKFDGPAADLLQRPDILRAVYVRGTAAMGGGTSVVAESAQRRRDTELATAPVVLATDGLAKRFGGVTAVDGISLRLRRGEVVGIVGPNGSGKTTLFDLISGEQRPDAGQVILFDQDVTELTPEARARRKLLRRFQDARLFPSLTVFEALLVALDQQLEVRNTFLAAISLPQSRRAERRLRAKADRLLEMLALQPYRDKFVSELSTGVRRIVDLAFVLATEAQVILLDEPSSGIAQSEAENLGPLIRRIRFETGCSILIIEHDMPLIQAVSDRMYALDRGRVIAEGRPDAVLEQEDVIESFLGSSEAAIRRSGSAV